MAFLTLKDLDFKEKTVLVRVDFNVPLANGNVTDDKRIRAALPTIEYLLKQKAIVILMSHLGKPDGGVVEELRMDAVAATLSKLLKKPVHKLDDCVGAEVEDFLNECTFGEIVLLENLRFHAEEELNDDDFSQSLAELADVFVNDAFGTMHRAHASVVGITKYLPSCAGFLVEKELTMLGKLLQNPERPFVAIMGGAKVSDKINVIKNLLTKVDALLIGGAMMFTFLALGYEVGKSKVERDKMALAKELLGNKKIVLPTDTIVAPSVDAKATVVSVKEMPAEQIGLDIGPETLATYISILQKAKTVFWNGPMGMFEVKQFAAGTNELAKAMANSKATTVVGGGDAVAAVEQLKLEDKFTHVSTGGGASLEFLEGKKLPGVAALEEAARRKA